ncbi:hypothetical protein ACHAXS_012906 [Conticribra weissflogii]
MRKTAGWVDGFTLSIDLRVEFKRENATCPHLMRGTLGWVNGLLISANSKIKANCHQIMFTC